MKTNLTILLFLLVATTRAAIIWDGSHDQFWGEDNNWLGPVPTAADDVLFDDTAIGFTVNLGSESRAANSLTIDSATAYTIKNQIDTPSLTLSLGDVTVLSGMGHIITAPVNLASDATYSIAAGADLTIEDSMSGTHSLTKTGNGQLILGRYNTDTGDTIINAGSIRIDNQSALQYRSVTLNVDGGLETNGHLAYLGSLAGSGDFDTNGAGVAVGLDDTDTTYSGTLTSLASGSHLELIEKTGNGTWTLTGADYNIETGFYVSDGHVIFDGVNGVIELFSSTAGTNITFCGGAALNIGETDTTTIEGFTATDAGTEVNFGSIRYTGEMRVENGASVDVGSLLDFNGGVLIVDGGTVHAADIRDSVGDGGTIQLSDPSGGIALTLDLASDATFSGVISDYTNGPGSIVKKGPGILSLGGDNTYSGDTVINEGAIFLLPNADDFNTSLQNSTVYLNVDNGLQHDALSEIHIGALAGSGDYDANGSYVEVGGNNASTTYSGNLTDAFLALRKEGTGTWTLAGSELLISEFLVGDGAVIFDGAAGSVGALRSAYQPVTFQNGANVNVVNLGGNSITIDRSSVTVTLITPFVTGDTIAISDPDVGTALTFNSASDREVPSTITDHTSGPGSVVKTGSGSLTLTGDNTYTGDTIINGGTLIVEGSISSSTTVNAGGTLGGSGTIGELLIADGGILSPGSPDGTGGASPGILTAGDTTWTGGGNYIFNINNATGIAGTNRDLLDITGTLDLTSLSIADPFTITLFSLDGDNSFGNAENFDPAQDYSWVLVSTNGGIAGFSEDNFLIDTLSFLNSPDSDRFSLMSNSGQIFLNYSAIPEPNYGIAIALLLAAVIWKRRGRRRILSGVLQVIVLATGAIILAGGLASTGWAQITVTGHYFPNDLSYWTNGGGTKNGTIGASSDGTLDVRGGSTLNLKNTYFGSGTAGSTATITLTGSGSGIAISHLFYLGNNTGIGNMTISDGGYLHTASIGTLGAGGATASGTMTIDGSGSLWEADDIVYVGYNGQGTLTIQNQGAFDGEDLRLGINEGAMGTLTVTGNGSTEHSTMTLSGNLAIGSGSSGLVSNGGQVHANREISVSGSLMVEGAGSEMTSGAGVAGDRFYVSSGDGLATMTVRDGALVRSQHLVIGSGDGHYGSLTVTGGDTEWQSTQSVNIGHGGGTGDIHVSDGGRLTTETFIYIRSGSTMNVLGEGSSVTAGGFDQSSGGSTIIDGASLSLLRLEGSGTISIRNPAGGPALTVGGDDGATSVFAGVIQDYSGGPGSITKTGSNSLVLSGDSTYSGGTTIEGGILQLGDGGTSGWIAGDIVNDGILRFNRSDDATYSGVISGTGSVEQAGSGTTILTGTSSYTGGTTISAGTLQLGDGGATGIVPGGILNNATLVIDRTDDFTFSNLISGTGDFIKRGIGGDLTLSAANTFSGTTAIEQGRIFLGHSLALQNSTVELSNDFSLGLNGNDATLGGLSGSGAIWVGSGQTLTVGGNDASTTFSGIVNGPGNFIKTGGGSLTLATPQNSSGSTTIQGGSIIIGIAQALQNSTVSIDVDDGLDLNGFNTTLGGLSGSGNLALSTQTLTVGTNNASTTYSGVLSGAGGLTKQGDGTLTLGSANTFSGDTVIDAGSIQLNNDQALQNSTVHLNVDGALMLNGHSLYIGALAGSANFNTGTAETYVGANGASTTYSGNLNVGYYLGKSGSGTWTLTGTGHDVGELAVTGGEVVFDGAGGAIDDLHVGSSGQATFENGASMNVGNLGGSSVTVTVADTNITFTNISTIDTLTVEQAARAEVTGNLFLTSGEIIVDEAFFFISGSISASNGDRIYISDPDGGTALVFDISSIQEEFRGIIADHTSGSGSIEKLGSGTLTLSGANTYSGGTSISQGSVRIGNSSGSAFGSGDVTVQSDASLTGVGSFTGALIVDAGGTFDPGNSPGLVTVGDGTMLNGILNMEIGGTLRGIEYDAINVDSGGTITLGAL